MPVVNHQLRRRQAVSRWHPSFNAEPNPRCWLQLVIRQGHQLLCSSRQAPISAVEMAWACQTAGLHPRLDTGRTIVDKPSADCGSKSSPILLSRRAYRARLPSMTVRPPSSLLVLLLLTACAKSDLDDASSYAPIAVSFVSAGLSFGSTALARPAARQILPRREVEVLQMATPPRCRPSLNSEGLVIDKPPPLDFLARCSVYCRSKKRAPP